MIGVPKAYPREWAPRAWGSGPLFHDPMLRIPRLIASVTDEDAAEPLAIAWAQDGCEPSGSWRWQGRRPCLGPLAQGHGAYPLAAPRQDRAGCRRPLLPLPGVQGPINAITTYRQARWTAPGRRPGLGEPAAPLLALRRLAMRGPPCPQPPQELPQGGTRPGHPRGLWYALQPLALGMRRSPTANPLGQGRRSHPSFHPPGERHGLEGLPPGGPPFLEPPPDDHGAAQRGNGRALLPASTLDLALPPQARRRRCMVCGFHLRPAPGHNPAAHLPQQGAKFPLHLRHRLGWRLIVAKLLKEPPPRGKETGEVRHQRPHGGGQQDLGRCRLDQREAPAQRHEGCWLLPPGDAKEPLASNRLRAGPESPCVGIARSHPRQATRVGSCLLPIYHRIF